MALRNGVASVLLLVSPLLAQGCAAVTCSPAYTPVVTPEYLEQGLVEIAIGSIIDSLCQDSRTYYEGSLPDLVSRPWTRKGQFDRRRSDIVRSALEAELAQAGVVVHDLPANPALILKCSILNCEAVLETKLLDSNLLHLRVSIRFEWLDPHGGNILESNNRTEFKTETLGVGNVPRTSSQIKDIGDILIRSMLARAIATEITSSIELSWEHAKRCNTFASYKQFLAKNVSNPNAARIADAREALETLAYQEAAANGSVSAFEAYLRQYPGGRYTSEAMNAIPEACLKDARSSNRLSSWRRFLAYQPDHKAADEARQAVSAIEKRVHDQKPELDTPVTNGDISIKVHAASSRWSSARASRVVKVDGKSNKEYIMCPDGVATDSSALLASWEGYQTITVTWNLESPRDGDRITVTVLGPDGSAVPIRKEDEVSPGKIEFGVLRQDASKEWTISIGSDPPFPPIVFVPSDLP